MTKDHQTFSPATDQPQKAITRMSIISALPDQVSSKLGDEAVILNIKTGTYFGLNDVGSRIWSLIQEPTSIDTVIQTVLDEYDVDPKKCEADVLDLTKKMIDATLVEVRNGKDSQISTG